MQESVFQNDKSWNVGDVFCEKRKEFGSEQLNTIFTNVKGDTENLVLLGASLLLLIYLSDMKSKCKNKYSL